MPFGASFLAPREKRDVVRWWLGKRLLLCKLLNNAWKVSYTSNDRIVQGAKNLVEGLIQMTQGKGVINTGFIERLNATFRQRISALTRRTRNLSQQAETLIAGMFLLGCFYNFCDFHKSLRLKLSVGRSAIVGCNALQPLPQA